MPDEKKCFVIMPITTPESLRQYRDGDDHFSHVLQLFIHPEYRESWLRCNPHLQREPI